MSVATWGAGAAGAVGTGELKDELLPVVVEGQLRGKHVVGVAAGEQHSLALDDLGNVYTWGRNREGQCGQNTTQYHHAAPMRVEHLLRERITRIVAGGHQSFAITTDGRLYRWGLFHEMSAEEDGGHRYFGIGDAIQHSAELKEMVDRSYYYYLSARDDLGTMGDDHTAMSEAIASTVALKRRMVRVPELLHVGPSEDEDTVDGRPITPADRCVVSVAAGYGFHLILTASGAIYSFGFNDKGQLGHGDRFAKDTPMRIMALAPYTIVSVAAGQQHSVAITAEGHMFTWGGGVFGIGHGDGRDVLSPRLVSALAHVRIREVSCGTYHTFCVTEGDQQLVFSFGHGEYGQQGRGDIGGEGGGEDRNALLPRPFEIRNNDGAMQILSIACGHLHTLFRLEDGSLWSCGWGANGVLGHGDKKYRLSPAAIRALEGDTILHAAGGWKHNVIVKEGSTTFAFDFERLLVPSTISLTDVVFVVEGKRVVAHSVIVSARSMHLASMIAFHRRFCPTADVEIVIRKARFVVFQAILRYLYTDHLKVPLYFVPEVATLARRFQLPRLVVLCERLTSSNRGVRTGVTSTFGDDMGQMVDCPRFSDVTFVVPDADDPSKTVDVSAHRAVLIARCAYFRALWDASRGFNDLQRRTVTVPFSAPVLLVVLRYVYSGSQARSLIDGENALEVLGAADFFLLDDLKQICEDIIEKELTKDVELLNDRELVADICESAQRHSAHRLEAFCSAHLAQPPPPALSSSSSSLL